MSRAEVRRLTVEEAGRTAVVEVRVLPGEVLNAARRQELTAHVSEHLRTGRFGEEFERMTPYEIQQVLDAEGAAAAEAAGTCFGCKHPLAGHIDAPAKCGCCNGNLYRVDRP